MHEHTLYGLQSTPLGSYLKALGVLRLLSEQADPRATGHFTDDGFVIQTELAREDVDRFFLDEYRPSPIANPWNGAGGFYFREDKATGRRDKETAATRALAAVRDAAAERLAPLRDALHAARSVVDAMELDAAPKDDDKVRLVNRLRDRLSDEAVAWIDAALVVGADDLGFPPILGTGGTEGALDFASNFYQRLADLFDFQTGHPTAESAVLLRAALDGEAIRGLTKAAIGQFDPGSAGGGNAAPGFDGQSIVNPWDFVLLLEGTFLLASAATKKLASRGPGALVYPFSVRAVGAGYGSASAADESDTRNELWLPLWQAPAGRGELARLFGEGRAEVGRRQAVHAIDFARAIGTLGVDRGLKAFQRYGFHKRNGKSYFATPLGRWRVKRNPNVELIDDRLSRWIDRLRSAARGTHAPASWQRAAKAVECSLLVLAGSPPSTARAVQDLLGAIAAAEATVGRTADGRMKLPPAPPRSVHWLVRADDGTVEHQLAVSLASTPIRERLTAARWSPRGVVWATNEDKRSCWTACSLELGLAAIVCREQIESQQSIGAPARSGIEPPVSALDAFLSRSVDDERLRHLISAYSLVPPSWVRPPKPGTTSPRGLPAAWALCMLVHQRFDPTAPPDTEEVLPATPALVHALVSNKGAHATEVAARRLRSTGARLSIGRVPLPPQASLRIAASLAFPAGAHLRDTAIELVTWQPRSAAERADAENESQTTNP